MAPSIDAFCAQNDARISELAQRFRDYLPDGGCDRARIIRWLQDFSAQHREIGLRLAECIEYYSAPRLIGLLQTLNQQIQDEAARIGVGHESIYFSPLGRTAESGQQVTAHFRNANKLQGNTARFVQTAELFQIIYEQDNPAVFFLDDFIGTGKQVCDKWDETLSQIIDPDWGHFYIAVCAAFDGGIQRIEAHTPLKVLAIHQLGARHQLTSEVDERLNRAQRAALKSYCKAIQNHPLGFGELAALVSFAHGTPNNAPSLIRGSERQSPKRGLLPGWEDL